MLLLAARATLPSRFVWVAHERVGVLWVTDKDDEELGVFFARNTHSRLSFVWCSLCDR